jgi:hypothetical protein
MDINKMYMAVLGKISKECLAFGNYRASGPPIYIYSWLKKTTSPPAASTSTCPHPLDIKSMS